MLVNGKWQKKWDPVQSKDAQGRFVRQSSAFRAAPSAARVMTAVDDVEALGLKLYVAYICPWATRTLIARSLLGLDHYIPISVVEPVLSDSGWQFGDFPGSTPVAEETITYIHQLYTTTDPAYSGRATVPVLWDAGAGAIMNNESADILRIFNHDLRPLHRSEIDLLPVAQASQIDQFNQGIYESLNNGVYKAGFASSQQAYEEAYTGVFATLDRLEQHFSEHQFAVGEQLTESDIRLFVTLVRFDPVYFSLFKTNRQRIGDYSALSAYLERLLQIDAFSQNTRIDHIKSGYYSIKALNPQGFVPAGPQLSWYRYLQDR